MKSLHLLLVAMVAIPSQSREGNENYITWFPVEGEGVFASTKGEIYIPSSISNRRNRQKRYSHSEPEEVMYYPFEELNNDNNGKYNMHGFNVPSHALPNFPPNKNIYLFPSSPFKSNKAWVKGIGQKTPKQIHSLNQAKDYSSASLEEYEVKKHIPNHHNIYQGFEPYHEMYYQHPQANHNWQEQYYELKHHHDTTFEKEKPVTENVNESSFPKPYVSSISRPNGKQAPQVPKKNGSLRSSSWSHNANHFELPNKPGDFTFPDPNESDGFYSPSALQQYQNQFNNFESENIYKPENIDKPSADLVFSSSSTEEFTKQPSHSVHPIWSATPVASDDFVFPGETERKTKSPATTTGNTRLTTTFTDCESLCQVTPEFNPVCGTDSTTYSNIGKLKCAIKCGKDVHFYHYGSCGRSHFATPLN